MLWIRNIIFASCVITVVDGRSLYKKRSKGKSVRSDEHWLVDSVSINIRRRHHTWSNKIFVHY